MLRVPRHSHWGLAPGKALAYQAAAFERAAPSGRVPRLFATIRPSDDIPYGALVVEEISGRAPRLPADLAAIADTLLKIHALALPRRSARPPLIDQIDPVAATVTVIRQQMAYLDAAGIEAGARAQIEEEFAWAQEFATSIGRRIHPRRLVLTDTQPGNFLIDKSGAAWSVDLEKSVYGSPAIDLAHATLYGSTRWDPDCATTLRMADVVDFYQLYLASADPAYAHRLRPWLAPLRRLTWLRTTTIFAKMKAEWHAGDWSGALLHPIFLKHVLRHIDDCHRPDSIAAMRAEWLEDRGLDTLLLCS